MNQSRPEIFSVILYTTIFSISYLTIKVAIFSIENIKTISIKEWFVYAGIDVLTYLWGRISYGFFYTLFLMLLFSPLLLIAASLTAIGPSNILCILLIIYLFILNVYMLGFMFYSFFKKQHWILTLILWFSLLLILFISPAVFPLNHPALLLLKLQSSTRLWQDLRLPLTVSGLTLLLLIVISSLSVLLYKRSLNE
jgi:hypothetical protein